MTRFMQIFTKSILLAFSFTLLSASYADAESGAEKTSTSRWLPDGTAVNDATAASNILDTTDVAAQTTFEVTSVAATGTATGSAVTSAGITVASAPLVAAIPVLTFESVKTFRFSWTDVADATHYKLLENPDSSAGFTQVGSDIPQGTQSIDHVVPLYARLNAQYILQSCNAVDCTDSASIAVSGSLVGSIGYFKASNTERIDRFGGAVALSADGRTLAVGAIGEDSDAVGIDGDQGNNLALNSGAVYIFSRDNAGVWGGTPTYVKASNTEANDFFGIAVALSADGNTLAVGALGEDSAGIRGSDNSESRSGAVYVYSRDTTSTTTSFGDWSDAFYIKASTVAVNIDAFDNFGRALALSADGNTLAVGATGEDSDAVGIDGDQANNTAWDSGAVYVFSRDSVGVWGGAPTYVKASNTESSDFFGTALALSADGSTLAVGATGEASLIGLTQGNNGARRSGAVYVYSRGTGGIWSDAFYVKASKTVPTKIDADDAFGSSVALSADGSTLVVGAIGERSNATGIDGGQSDNSNIRAGAVYVFNRLGNGGWQNEPTYLKASNTGAEDEFGGAVALSADGNTLAVGARFEDSDAVGIDSDQANGTISDSGAVYVFKRDGGSWSQRAYVKASNTGVGDEFGVAISLSGDGSTLAVGGRYEDSSATGIDGDQVDDTAPMSGAVYVY
jgi:hypothetical protein